MPKDPTFMDQFSQFLEEHPKEGQQVLDLNWEGQRLMSIRRTKAAEQKFREAIAICEYAIPALNNLALCMQQRGDIKRAIRTAHRVLEFRPTDVFAHCTLAECYQQMNRTDKAGSHVERAISLLEDPEVPLDKLPKVIEALAILQMDERIMDLYRSYREGIGFEDVMDGVSWFYIGVAAANIGLIDDAISLFRRAFEEDQEMGLAEVCADALRLVKEKRAPSFHLLYQIDDDKEELDPKHPSDGIKPIIVVGLWDNTLHDDYKHHVVDLLTAWQDAWAEEFLRTIIIQPELPDDVKMHAVAALGERGALRENEPIEVFVDGKRREVVIKKREVVPPSPEVIKQFELGVSRADRGDIAGAEEAYRKALKIDPDFPEALVNLGNICRFTDRTEEGAQLLERAVALTGDSKAILNLAAVYILDQHHIEEGGELVDELEMDDIDEEMLPLYYRLIGYLEVYSGEFDEARDAFNKMISLDPNDETGSDLLDWVTRAEAVREYDRKLWNRRRERYLRQPVDPNMSLVIALNILTKDNLIGVTHWYDLSYGMLRKADLAQMIADHLLKEETDIWKGMTDEAWDALEYLDSVGGSAPLAKLEEKFGSTEDDSINWRYHVPLSPIGELQSKGLLFVGRDTSKETIAFIPREILQRFRM